MPKRDVNIIIKARDAASQQFGQVTRSTERFANKLVRTGDETDMMGIKLGALAGVAATTALAFKGLQASVTEAANFEKLSLAFETLVGDASKAQGLMKELEEFSIKTPFTPDEVLNASKVLVSFGLETDKVSGTMAMLGDVSAGTGKDLNELARIFGKVFTKGRAQGEELNQMAEAGIPILQELAAMYGTTTGEVLKMGEKGKLTFDVIEKAFGRMTSEGGRFFGMVNKQSATFAGKMSTLDGNVKKASRGIGSLFLPSLKSFADVLNEDVLPAVNEVIDGLKAFGGIDQPDLGPVVNALDQVGQKATATAEKGKLDFDAMFKGMTQAEELMDRFNISRGQAEVALSRTPEGRKYYIKGILERREALEKEQRERDRIAKAEEKASQRIRGQIEALKEQVRIQKLIARGKEKEAFIIKQITRAEKDRKLTPQEKSDLINMSSQLFDLQKMKGAKTGQAGALDQARQPIQATVSRFRTFQEGAGENKTIQDNVAANKATAENTRRLTDIMLARLNQDRLAEQGQTVILSPNRY